MTRDVEAVVLEALQKAAGQLQDAASLTKLAAGDDISFAEWELDSLDRFEAIMLIEDALGVELDDAEVVAQTSFRVLVAYVAGQVEAAA